MAASGQVYSYADNPILYVKMGGNGDGSSWADAMGDIQAAINSPGAEQVWVAKGTYYPGGDGLKMKNSVAIYGGFPDDDNDAGMEERDWTANPTILHGNNEKIVVNNSFAAGEPLTASAILDGFTITGGNSGYAGGIANLYASPVLRNLVITGNESEGEGGGMYNWYSTAALTNVVISGNSARVSSGGGIYNEESSPTFTNVRISQNSANNKGGGVYNRNSSPLFVNVLFDGNTSGAEEGGGGVYDECSSSTFINVTVSRNRVIQLLDRAGGIYLDKSSSALIRNSIIWGNIEERGNFGGSVGDRLDPASSHNIIEDEEGTYPDPQFVNPAGGDYRLSFSSPAIDAGINDAFPGLNGAKDLAGKDRLYGTMIDIGAYEWWEGQLPVTLVSFKAIREENTVQLSWQTTEEVNASHFEIQRSADSKNFESIGSVAVKGSGKYTFTDAPFGYAQGAALFYYRLKMMDLDGTYAYSEIRSVSFKKAGNVISRNKLYPNPSAQGMVILETADAQADPAIRIFDGLGREIPARISGSNGRYFIETAGLPAGMYHVQVKSAGGQRGMKLLVE